MVGREVVGMAVVGASVVGECVVGANVVGAEVVGWDVVGANVVGELVGSAVVGERVGAPLGLLEGGTVGWYVVGGLEGLLVGDTVFPVGDEVGSAGATGWSVGCGVGCPVMGCAVGPGEGDLVGVAVLGEEVASEGEGVGYPLGGDDGDLVGEDEGDPVVGGVDGFAVGTSVGAVGFCVVTGCAVGPREGDTVGAVGDWVGDGNTGDRVGSLVLDTTMAPDDSLVDAEYPLNSSSLMSMLLMAILTRPQFVYSGSSLVVSSAMATLVIVYENATVSTATMPISVIPNPLRMMMKYKLVASPKWVSASKPPDPAFLFCSSLSVSVLISFLEAEFSLRTSVPGLGLPGTANCIESWRPRNTGGLRLDALC